MSKPILEHLPKGSLSPLWIIASFVSIVEVVATIAIIQTTGWTQEALTYFAIAFAFYIATLFFIVLWCKNHVFYGPWDFNEQDPSKFVAGMQSRPRDDKALFARFDEIICKSLTSTSNELTQNLQNRLGEIPTKEILERTAKQTMSDIKKNISIAVEASKEMYPVLDSDFSGLQLVIDDSKTVGDLLANVEYAANHFLEAHRYGQNWWLRDKAEPNSYLHRRSNDTVFFNRTLAESGIKPGMTLEIVNQPSTLPFF